MKFTANLPLQSPGHFAAGRAFTLPEIIIVMAIFSLVIAGLISAQIFGMRMLTISETKLSATATGRRALNAVRDEIRAGKILVVGNGNNSTFTPIADNTPQIGNALQIHPTTNTTNFVRYYLDPAEERLKRVVSGSSNIQVVANFVTNELPFAVEDFRGNVLTRNRNNRVIRLNLEFYQWGFPIASAGSGGMYDYYHLQTRISRRTIE
jgi:prepilin-type N-terminal cleavage/methylation domain-containing protein